MLRSISIALFMSSLFVSSPVMADGPARKPAPTKPTTTFPLPKDVQAPSAAPGGGGKITVYQVPRGRDLVVTEMRALWKAGGWTITKDDPSPSGRAVRIEVKNGDLVYKVSFTGDADRTALIVTAP